MKSLFGPVLVFLTIPLLNYVSVHEIHINQFIPPAGYRINGKPNEEYSPHLSLYVGANIDTQTIVPGILKKNVFIPDGRLDVSLGPVQINDNRYRNRVISFERGLITYMDGSQEQIEALNADNEFVARPGSTAFLEITETRYSQVDKPIREIELLGKMNFNEEVERFSLQWSSTDSVNTTITVR